MTNSRPIRLTIGSLFAGVGGLELGLEWAGLGPVVWQAESDEWCRRVLAAHWPDAVRYDDVRAIDEQTETVDVICGGLPCQDLSHAGRRAGISGDRSGLWCAMLRAVELLRPTWVIGENVHHAWRSWVPFVRRDLLRAGYACVPIRVRAADCGAVHARARTFVVAHTDIRGCKAGMAGQAVRQRPPRSDAQLRSGWHSEPGVRRALHGHASRLDRRRLAALGNAVVPQCAEVIGRAIMDAERREAA